MPASNIETTQQFAWDSPWSSTFLVTAGLLFAAWSLYQLFREARFSQTRLTPLFLLLRSIVAAILLWMILGPTSVLVREETHPKTLAVYIDNSSSMQIQDQPDPLEDHRWELAAQSAPDPLSTADQAALYASTLRREAVRLADLVEQQASIEERRESIDRWLALSGHCTTSLASTALKNTLNSEQQDRLAELTALLQQDLQPLLATSDWLTGSDPGDREERLVRLVEQADQFAVRCRIFAESVSQTSTAQASPPSHSANSPLPTRIAKTLPAAQHALSQWLAQGRDKFRIRLAQFSTKVTPLPMVDWGAAFARTDSQSTSSPQVLRTDLAELLKQIRDDSGKEEFAAAVIFSDGRHSVDSPEDPRALASQLRIPLYLVPIGRGEMKRDVILHHLHAPPTVIQKDKILIEGIVTAYRCPNESCEVQLLENEKVVETKTINFKNDQEDQRFNFVVPTEQTGRREFKLRVPELAKEQSPDNNFAAVGVDVADAVLKLLLADGRARWEHQYLVNLFKRQDRIEFDQLKFAPQPAGTGKREASRQFPRTVEEWAEYRVVILGDVSPRQLTRESQEALREFVVQRGGCVIIIAGQNDMPHSFEGEPLQELLPVELTSGFTPARAGYRVELTVEAKTSDVMQLSEDFSSTEAVWREMSASLPIYFLSGYHKPKPTSRVLLNALPVEDASPDAETPAFLSWQQVGAGRVAYLSSPATYQLRMRNGDKFHHRFWGQLIRWVASNSTLSGSRRVKLLADKSNYNQGDASQITVELSDEQARPVTAASPQVDVIQQGAVRSSLPLTPDPQVPGRYTGKFSPEDVGRYSLRVRGPEVERLLAAENYSSPVQVDITFEPGLDRELLDPRSDRPLLEQLAAQTGGLVLEPTMLAELAQALPLEPRRVETRERTPLWDRWWCLWVILGCLSLEWIVRKQVGLA